MRVNKLYIAVGLIIAFGLFFELAAHADTTNHKITITFSAPMQTSGQVLPAGTYIFQQADLVPTNTLSTRKYQRR